MTKIYYALVGGAIEQLNEHQLIEKPIGRDLSSLLKRQVIETGQFASTEYWLAKEEPKRDCAHSAPYRTNTPNSGTF